MNMSDQINSNFIVRGDEGNRKGVRGRMLWKWLLRRCFSEKAKSVSTCQVEGATCTEASGDLSFS